MVCSAGGALSVLTPPSPSLFAMGLVGVVFWVWAWNLVLMVCESVRKSRGNAMKTVEKQGKTVMNSQVTKQVLGAFLSIVYGFLLV